MITRNALYTFIESVITNAPADSPLKGASSFRSLKGSVNETQKVVRCDCFSGKLAKTDDPRCEEMDVDGIIQCFVTPNDDSLSAMDAAKDLAMDMSKQIYKRLTDSDGQTLGGLVEQVTGFDEFDIDEASLGSVARGAIYNYGKIN